mmetsp:Transcript_8858/g.26583  ORF Transcript_8858/g.26583 Transcript_8858/m.26583 type:complete len:162 (+) Transcript_8858:1235-1720(+)
MGAAVNAADAAREAKHLAFTAAKVTQTAIEKSGICNLQHHNFSQPGSTCSQQRPRPELGPLTLARQSSEDDWNELGFYASRFHAQTIQTENVQTLSHLHFDHLVISRVFSVSYRHAVANTGCIQSFSCPHSKKDSQRAETQISNCKIRCIDSPQLGPVSPL